MILTAAEERVATAIVAVVQGHGHTQWEWRAKIGKYCFVCAECKEILWSGTSAEQDDLLYSTMDKLTARHTKQALIRLLRDAQ